MNTRKPLHCRVESNRQRNPRERRCQTCLQGLKQDFRLQNNEEASAAEKCSRHEWHLSNLCDAKEQQVWFPEQTLDEYCHEFLDAASLQYRDENQVVSRYFRGKRKPNNGNATNLKNAEKDSQGLHSTDSIHNEEIVVVSQLWLWRLGGSFQPFFHLVS